MNHLKIYENFLLDRNKLLDDIKEVDDMLRL